MKHEKGSRKIAVVHEQTLMLFGGLIVCLGVACFLFKDAQGKIDPSGVDLVFKMFLVYAGGLLGKTSAFMWGNAKENQAAAPKP